MTSGRCGRGPRSWCHDNPWPPSPGFGADARARARFFRRLALAAMALVALAAFGIIAIAWAIGDRAGAPGLALTAVAVGLLVSLVVLSPAVRALRRGVAPLRAVMDAADRVADGDYEVRVAEHGPPPVRALARSFNAMTGRLQNADTLRRELMADVAHELRTPLSVLQGRLEGLADGVYPRDDAQIAALLEETAVLSTLVEDLRTLALADAGVLRLQREPTDLAGLARTVARGFDGEAARRGVTLRVDAPAEVERDVDPLRIRQVLTNLLSNALRHTPSGRAISVTVADGGSAGATVSVVDEGEGMPAEDVPRIFDRFYKGEGSRGSGLGLTIAKRLVHAHGGEITATSRAGQGTTVAFTLPSR